MDSQVRSDLNTLWRNAVLRKALTEFLEQEAQMKIDAMRSAVNAGDLVGAAKAEGAIQALQAIPEGLTSIVRQYGS